MTRCITALICIILLGAAAKAQIPGEEFRFRSWELDTARATGELRLNVDGSLFFRDNEFSSKSMDGYTLPGFRLTPRAAYRPSHAVELQLGVYALRFWGADRYPNLAYRDIAVWKGYKTSGLHLLPWLRVQMALDNGVNIVLGDIHGRSCHRLLMPLYAPELDLTADPEAGAQVLYSGRRFDVDLWVSWESFIFRDDTHQESFVAGFSGRYKYNGTGSRLHLYTPLQVMAQHRGGEIDTITSESVQTLVNAATGLGAEWHTGHRRLHTVSAEAALLGYWQQAGELWPVQKGWGVWLQGALHLPSSRINAGWFRAHNFISMFGYPMFGSLSTRFPGLTFSNPSTLYLGFDWSREVSPGYRVGIDVDVFRQGSCTGRYSDRGSRERINASTSFAAGIYMRFDPSFLLCRPLVRTK